MNHHLVNSLGLIQSEPDYTINWCWLVRGKAVWVSQLF